MVSSCRGILGSVLALCLVLVSSLPGQASVIGSGGGVVAAFTNPVLIGNIIIPPQGTLSPMDNTATAVFSGLGTNFFSWGANAGFSEVAFIGNDLTGAAFNTPISLGTFIYFNGTSDLSTLVFGVDMTLSIPGANVSVTPLLSHLTINTTSNLGDLAQNADFIGFDAFPNTFNVFEGATATAQLIGTLHGDPTITLDGLVLDPGQEANGFIGTGFPATPEPATMLLMGIGAAGMAFVRKRKARMAC